MSDYLRINLLQGTNKELHVTLNPADLEFAVLALEVAKKTFAERATAKPIPPGTRVRYGMGGTWYYGTVAASDAPYYPGGDSCIVGNVRAADRVWAHWDGDTNAFASYRMRAHVEVVR